jgi:hypothetical protein
LELSFATLTIRDLCEHREDAVATLGLDAALELEQRLADIDAIDNAAELIALFGEVVTALSSNTLSLHLSTGHKVVLASGHPTPRVTEKGATDWGKVTRMRVDQIGGQDG